MTRTSLARLKSAVALATLLASCACVAPPSTAIAQPAAGAGGAHAAGQDPQLVKQVEDLRAQVMRLQAALDQKGSMPAADPAPAMAMGDDMGAMAAMPPAMPMTAPPAAMPPAPPGGMAMGGMGMMGMMEMMGMPPKDPNMPAGMMMGEMGMGGMKSGAAMSPAAAPPMSPPAAGSASMPASPGMTMGGAAPMAPAAAVAMPALPGVPPGSHLYHVGASGFFLDQPQIMLTSAQRGALTKIKDRALVARADAVRRSEQLEQDLWTLTGADQPSSSAVQAKAQEIEQIRTTQRLGFIRAVGEASALLTPEQRSNLQGT